MIHCANCGHADRLHRDPEDGSTGCLILGCTCERFLRSEDLTARLDRIERKLDWLKDCEVGRHITTSPSGLEWPGDTPTSLPKET